MRVLILLLIVVVTSGIASAQTPEQGFFEWTELSFSKDVYAGRREKVIQRIRESGGGKLFVPSRHGVSDGFTFRQLDDFLYFTGLELPDSVLVIDADSAGVTLYTTDHDARYANPSRRNDFPGRRLRADPELSEVSGLSDIQTMDALDARVAKWVRDGAKLRVNYGRRGDVPETKTGFTGSPSAAEVLVAHLRARFQATNVLNAYDAVARVRMVHGPEEIKAIRAVCDVTVRAIWHAAGFVRDGIDERGLEAELEAEYKRRGAQRLAFASIIKSGPNSLWPWRILAANHDRRNRAMKNGELVIFDVGTELDYYVSDVGRTFPVSGKFTDEQREILEMATSVSDAILAAIKPGVSFADLKKIAVAAIPPDQRGYMQAGGFFGHHIGLSTGDPALTDLPLEPGMVFTVEPWYYNHDDDIAVFVEDVVLVTADGHENLTAALPRDTRSLESMTGVR